jgi:dihydroflavonol-4-reductase
MNTGIIGATGMLGHHTALAALKAGHQLFVIHRKGSDLSKISDLNFESRIGDLNDPATLREAMQGLDMVINCGAYYPTAPRPLTEDLRVAETQMRNFIEAVRQSGIKKALYVGGSIAIPRSPTGTGDEDAVYETDPENKNNYVQVKWLMDKMAREAGRTGVPIVIGVPTMTFGEYDSGPSTGTIIVQVANGTMKGFVNGPRNMVYAGDAGRGLLLACEKGNIGERYLITGENAHIGDLVQTIAEVAKVPVPKRELSLGTAKTLSRIMGLRYRLFGGKPPLLNSTTIAIMASGQFFDGAKAKALGYAPTVSIRQAVERAVKWFEENAYIKK